MYDKITEQRYLADFPLDLPHESFARNFENSPDEFDISKFDPKMFPPTFADHAVVKTKGALAFPIGFFSDAVPHTKNDSFIIFYWSNTLTCKRYQICSVRTMSK